MIHRYAVGTLSLIIIALAALALRTRRQRLMSVPFALALVATLVVQALLGMLTVTWQLNPLIVTLHLLFGMTTLALLWWLTLSLPMTSWGASAMRGPGRSISGGGAAALRQRRAPDAPGSCGPDRADRARRLDQQQLCRHRLPGLPHLPGESVAARGLTRTRSCRGTATTQLRGRRAREPRARRHPPHAPAEALLAATTLALAALFVLRRRGLSAARPRAWLVLAALALQLSLGVSLVLKGFPLWLATAHTAGAALLLLATLALLRALSAR